ncbi:CoA transferase [Dehalococcoidia bacterium]|nr:CoA transferase [Dehalococcoidia bacterium]
MTELPLEGLRIISLSQVYAGPYAGKLLADMGAEVIKIESAVRSGRGGRQPQPGAVYPDGQPGETPYNRSAYYNELNRNKYAVGLDLSGEQGREIFKKLVRISDVVLENFSPRVMANFGLDYPTLRQIKPEIIMVSISAYGQTGPYRDYVSFGRGIEAMSGLSQVTGYEDSQPLGPGIAYADATAGLHAAFATLVALRHRRRTGKGQHIDLSLRESLIPLLGEHLLDYSMNRRSPQRRGNRDSSATFQGCYRCRGDDAWIAIAICDDGEWRAFCSALGNPPWTTEERFATSSRRQQNQRDLERNIERWTTGHQPGEAMCILQQAGIRAGAVRSADELTRDPHLWERDFFEMVTHPEAGTHAHPGISWKLSRTPGRIRMPAPCFAEHNDYVFGELLGMSKEEMAKLAEKGVIATVPLR